ncbi:MAG: NADPH-dependent FMN reductase [Agromyces sp.]
MSELLIGIIIGSTRPGRVGHLVGNWVFEHATHEGLSFQLLDLRDFNLPNLDESVPGGSGRYEHEHTKAWAAAIAPLDGFIFVTPEYNHGVPGHLKNALDFLGPEWRNKAAGIVSYGSVGGARAAEQLRLVLTELQVANVRQQVMVNRITEFTKEGEFTPDDRHLKELDTLLGQLAAWAGALKPLRAG